MKKFLTSATTNGLFLLLVVTSYAAGQVNITFPDASTKMIWIVDQVPNAMPEGGREFARADVKLDIPNGLENGYIVVHDVSKGNIAIKRVSDAKSWNVSDSDYSIAQAIIQVEIDGAPMRTGIVIVDGSGRQLQAALEQGEAKLFNVPSGTIQVTVKYGEVGAEKVSPAQTLSLALDRTELIPVRKIALQSDASGSSPTDSGAKQGESDSQNEEQTSGEGVKETKAPDERGDSAAGGILQTCGNFILWLLVLAGAATVVVLLFRYFKKNQGRVAGGLQSLGIQIPDGSDTAGIPVSEPASKEFSSGAPIVQPGHCPYCGQPESMCQCRVDAKPNASAFTSAPSNVPGNLNLPSLKLTSDSGITLAISDGIATVGREAGSAQLVVGDPTVSRVHAEIEKSGGRIVVRDKGSSNGTFVNGSKISGDTEVRIGDTVQFGAVRFRLET
jgi:hypothetical protein